MNRIIVFLASLLLIASLFLTTSCLSPVNPLPDDGDTSQGEDGSQNSGNEETNENIDGGSNNNDNANQDDNTNGDDNSGDGTEDGNEEIIYEIPALTRSEFDPTTIPVYNNSKSYINLNDCNPTFTENQIVTDAYEYYSPLDSLGRCGVAVACLGRELLPTTERGSISSVSPTGWHGNAIYERSHLIAFSLAGEDANKNNLITGTYDLNSVMQEFETMVLDYIKETANHVMYRVEPVFTENNLVCIGVIMEAYSVEDQGEGICFNIFIYNAQDDIVIDYATGDYFEPASEYTFIVNKNNYKIHKPTCSGVRNMNETSKLGYTITLDELVALLTSEGKSWTYCGTCKPQNG